MRAIFLAGVAMLLGVSAATAQGEKDKASDRLTVKNGAIHRGKDPKTMLAVQQTGLCKPNLSDEELIKAFIRVSEVGGTALCFDLGGFNADGTALDPTHVKTAYKIKDAANYRWMPTVLRVLGALDDADEATRLNAVRTAAAAFENNWSVLYWIDGPNSEALAAEFKARAPKLMVLSAAGGDVQLLTDAKDAHGDGPAALLGALPARTGAVRHCILPDDPAIYESLEEFNRQPAEREAWQPSTVGLTQEEINDAWISLFDGESLDGWSIVGDNKKGFVSKDGMISWAASGGRKLQSRDRYDNFIFRGEWKVYAKNANNGMYFRAPRANRESKMGFEFQMFGDYGKKPDKNSTGSVYDVVAPTVNASKPEGEWNEIEIYLNGPVYKAKLNGVLIQDLDFDKNPELKYRLRKGFICISDHGQRASFRNLRIKKL